MTPLTAFNIGILIELPQIYNDNSNGLSLKNLKFYFPLDLIFHCYTITP